VGPGQTPQRKSLLLNPDTLGFVHVFGRNLRCTLTVSAEPPTQGVLRHQSCEWDGKLKPRHVPEYRRWILEVYRTLADRWGQKVLYALGISPRATELWAFEPGQAPRLIKKVPFGIS
jgi:hypothetical protein